jgi:hypothetical protein
LLAGFGVGAAGLLAGCSLFESERRNPSSVGTERDRFSPPGTGRRGASRSPTPVTEETVDDRRNAVEAGADPTGRRPIDDLLRAHSEDTLLVFPDGQYAIEGVALTDPRALGLTAAAGARPTFVPATPTDEGTCSARSPRAGAGRNCQRPAPA